LALTVFGVLWGEVAPFWLLFFVNKGIWTFLFVLLTGGLAAVLFGFIYWVVDVVGGKRWVAPFVIYGKNAIAVYVGAGLLADTGVFAACFGLAGLAVPWRGLLFAYAAGQLGARLVPLPGGLGGVEGGVLGALTLTGRPPAAAAAAIIVYRVVGTGRSAPSGPRRRLLLSRRRRGLPR
jgi:uncharacterized membrane protein YbhN (UPF0104 family)